MACIRTHFQSDKAKCIMSVMCVPVHVKTSGRSIPHACGHTTFNTPIRSHMNTQRLAGLVLGWETFWESLVLQVLFFLFFFTLLLLLFVINFSLTFSYTRV